MKSGFVAIIGQPNVGKSTLLNRFIGEKVAIVTPKPQTTRQNIVGIYNRKGAQAVFLDTPGFHESKKALNKFMMGKIGEALADADVILLMVEPKKRPDPVDLELFARAKEHEAKILLIINKIDTELVRPWEKVIDDYYSAFDSTPTVAISASAGHGCDFLLDKIIELLPEAEPFYPQDEMTSHPVRFLCAEIIREQAMLLLRQELPYSLAVEVEDYKDMLERGIVAQGGVVAKIRAAIIVEKDSQKGIVIGAGGKMIKEIGSLARAKIETLVGGKVFLELYVRVVADWTKNEDQLKRMGYE